MITGRNVLHRYLGVEAPAANALREAVSASVVYQRGLAEEEDVASRQAIIDQGCEIAELTAEEHALFAKAVQPLWADAQKSYGEEMFAMAER